MTSSRAVNAGVANKGLTDIEIAAKRKAVKKRWEDENREGQHALRQLRRAKQRYENKNKPKGWMPSEEKEKVVRRKLRTAHPFQAYLQALGFNVVPKTVGSMSFEQTANVLAFATTNPERDLRHIVDNIHRVRELAPDACRLYPDDEDLRLELRRIYSRVERCHKKDVVFFPRLGYFRPNNDR